MKSLMIIILILEVENEISLAWQKFEIVLGKLLSLDIKFQGIVLEVNSYEHCMFMKKNKLVHETIFLNVVDFMLHHVTHM